MKRRDAPVMTRRARTATPIPDAEARWEALHAAVPRAHWPWFEWITALRLTDGTRIDVFLHKWLNRELLLGDDGAVFALTPTFRYKEQEDRAWALELALPHRRHWLEMGGYVDPDDWRPRWDDDDSPPEEIPLQEDLAF